MTSEQMSIELTEARREIIVLSENMKAAFKRLDEQKEMANSIHSLAISVERQTAELKQQNRDIDSLRADLENIKAKPGHRWEVIVSGIISALLASGIAVFANTY